MPRTLLLILAVLTAATAFGASPKVTTVEGSAVFYIPATMTMAQAEEEVVRRAKIDALNRAFGNSLTVATTQITTETDDRFYSHGFDLVKGEWIETTGSPEIKRALDGDEIYLTCRIKGKARGKDTAETQLDVSLLRNGTTPACATTDFRAGDKMYLSFTTPADGYLAVYQYDPAADTAYCLLPYRHDGGGSVAVGHDTRHIFFSKADSPTPRMVDEYRLGCEADAEINTIYIIFSPRPFSRSLTGEGDRTTPRHLPYADFERWRARSQAQDPSMQVIPINITIKK